MKSCDNFRHIKTQIKIYSLFLAFSLAFGALSMPFQAQAGMFDWITGSKASADNSVPDLNKIDNSQSPSLSLEADSSSVSTFQDTKGKDNEIKDSASVNTSGNALIPTTGLMGVSVGTDTTDSSLVDTSVYVVRNGDSVAAIAKMFNVSANTILWANDLKKGDNLSEGDVLIILPMDGVNHIVVKGDTLKKIAKKYNVDISDIIAANDVTLDTGLDIGQELIIPGAAMSDEGGDKPVPNLKDNTVKDQNYYAKHPTIKNLAGYFINPLPSACYDDGSCRKTQGLHDHYAIDIGAPKGTPIYAAASGTIAFAKMGWNGGYGNLVIEQDSNGTESRYAHQSKIATHTGDQVSQGDVIGYVGSTGHSTGPHLHFEVRGARNPGVDWS